MKRIHIPPNGTVFLVPLPSNGFGLGVLIRACGEGRAYGAFFRVRVASESEIDIKHLKLADAIWRCKFGDYALRRQLWPVIGSVPNWGASPWTLPDFARRHDDPRMCFLIKCDDKLDVIATTLVELAQAKDLPDDAQFGSGVVEIKLDKLLST